MIEPANHEYAGRQLSNKTVSLHLAWLHGYVVRGWGFFRAASGETNVSFV